MYESLLKHTAEYQKISASLATPGPAALFGLPPLLPHIPDSQTALVLMTIP